MRSKPSPSIPRPAIRRCRGPTSGQTVRPYINHVELVRRARNAEVPASSYTDPLIYQGGSDSFIGPRDAIVADEAWGIDSEAEVTVVTGDVPLGATRPRRRRRSGW